MEPSSGFHPVTWERVTYTIIMKGKLVWKRKFKNICEGDIILWMPKSTTIKGSKFKLPWKGPYKVHNFFNNNIVKLAILGDDEVERININKLK
jgi:hypothetical protein